MSRSLHLVRPEPASDNDRLYFERRSADRNSVSGRVTAVLARPASDTIFGEPASRICSLRLLDVSDTGLGALSQDPLPVGARITIFIPPHGADPGYDMRGDIVRCAPREYGHHIGVRFSQRQAA